MKNLTPKQIVFCNEYIKDMNATQAAIRAGYSKRTAQVQSANLLSKIMVQQKIHELQLERSERTQVEADRVLLEIARIAFNDPRKAFDQDGNLLPIDKWPPELAAAVSSVKVTEVKSDGDVTTTVKEIKFWDKGKQIELAAKHLGMLTEKVQHTGTVDFNPIPKFDSPEAYIEWQEK